MTVRWAIFRVRRVLRRPESLVFRRIIVLLAKGIQSHTIRDAQFATGEQPLPKLSPRTEHFPLTDHPDEAGHAPRVHTQDRTLAFEIQTLQHSKELQAEIQLRV